MNSDSLVLKKFFGLFWRDELCQSVFLAHKEELLENEVDLILSKEFFLAQRIVLSNALERKKGSDIVRRAENEITELYHNTRAEVSRLFTEEKIKGLLSEKDIQLLQSLEKEYSDPIKLTKTFIDALFSEDPIIFLIEELRTKGFLTENIKTEEDFKVFLKEQVRSRMKSFLKQENLTKLSESIGLANTFYNNRTKHSLLNAHKHNMHILYDGDGFKNTVSLFDELFEIEAIKGGIQPGYYECVECEPNIYNGIVRTNLKPSRLTMKCPNCKKSLHYTVPYQIEESLYRAIKNPDGILFFALKYIYEKNKIRFESNYKNKDVEVDFLLLNSQGVIELVEVKMFKKGSESTLETNIEKTIKQVVSTTKKLMKEDGNFMYVPKTIILNRLTQEALIHASEKYAEDLDKYCIRILDIKQYSSFLASNLNTYK